MNPYYTPLNITYMDQVGKSNGESSKQKLDFGNGIVVHIEELSSEQMGIRKIENEQLDETEVEDEDDDIRDMFRIELVSKEMLDKIEIIEEVQELEVVRTESIIEE